MSLLTELDSTVSPNYKDVSPTGFEMKSTISKAEVLNLSLHGLPLSSRHGILLAQPFPKKSLRTN